MKHSMLAITLVALLFAPALRARAEEKKDASAPADKAAAAAPASVAAVSAAAAAELPTESDKISYIIGNEIGGNLKEIESEISRKAFMRGLEDGILGKTSMLSPEESMQIMQTFSKRIREQMTKKREEAGAKNLKDGEAFLEENKKKEGVKVTDSGLQYMVLAEGKGDQPKASDTVTVHYKGTLLDGTEFDSSYKTGEPATFKLNRVISGWTEGLQLMKTGAKYRFFIPSKLAYGEEGDPGGKIGPNSALIFEVELIGIEAAPAAPAPDKEASAKDAPAEKKADKKSEPK